MGLVARERAVGRTVPYRLSITRADAEGEPPRWIARVDGRPGCVGEGATPAAAAAAADAAAAGSAAPSHSGRLLLRLPKILHAELAGRADAAQVSLNQLIVGALAETVAGETPAPAAALRASQRLPQAVRLALAANALVVAVAAVAAALIVTGVWHPG
jgi:antitoxin HicB